MSHESLEDILARVIEEERRNPPGVRSAEWVARRNEEITRRALSDEDGE